MSVEPSKLIEDADFIYENTNTKILIKRNCPEIKIPGLTVGPFKEGKEYEVKFWIAKELEKNGIARFRDEEVLNAVRLYKLHWKESVQPAKQIAPLSSHFYPKLRRYLNDLKSQRIKKPEKICTIEKNTKNNIT